MDPSTGNQQAETIYRNGSNRLQFLFNIIAAVAAAGVIWVGTELITFSNFMAATNANRFTSGDALREFSKISERLARIESQITEIPPEWFIRQVEHIEERVDSVEAEIDEHTTSPHARISP